MGKLRVVSVRLVATLMLVVAGTAVPGTTVSAAGAQPEVRVVRMVDLGTLGGSFSQATGVNVFGQVVGYSLTTAGATHAFLWQSGKMRDLGTLGGSDSFAMGINARGQVVGFSNLAGGPSHAFLWQEGAMRDLGTLGGVESQARGVNNWGQVVGVAGTPQVGVTHAFLWQAGAAMRDLGTLPGDSFSDANAINDRGQVVGESSSGSAFRAFTWSNGAMTALPGLGGDAFARDINIRGDVAGASHLPGIDFHAVLWHAGVVHDLGTLGGANSDAGAINDFGQVVGSSDTTTPLKSDMFVWQRGSLTDVSALVPSRSDWAFIHPVSVTDLGQVVGDGQHAGATRAFLMLLSTT
jgi:probable HAF family extracellular repeat protein